MDILRALKRIRQADPVTFWCSIWGIITGNAAIFLHLWRLFR